MIDPASIKAGASVSGTLTQTRVMVETSSFRWAVINAVHPPQLQQAWKDYYGSGAVEWRAVPMVVVEDVK